MKSKYFITPDGSVKRLTNGKVFHATQFGRFSCFPTGWMTSCVYVNELNNSSRFKRISRDEARKRYPHSFRKPIHA